MKRYVVHPGSILSKTDRQLHHITFGQLVQLYQVDPKECINASDIQSTGRFSDAMVHLYPDYDGNYSLPCRGRNAGMR